MHGVWQVSSQATAFFFFEHFFFSLLLMPNVVASLRFSFDSFLFVYKFSWTLLLFLWRTNRGQHISSLQASDWYVRTHKFSLFRSLNSIMAWTEKCNRVMCACFWASTMVRSSYFQKIDDFSLKMANKIGLGICRINLHSLKCIIFFSNCEKCMCIKANLV